MRGGRPAPARCPDCDLPRRPIGRDVAAAAAAGFCQCGDPGLHRPLGMTKRLLHLTIDPEERDVGMKAITLWQPFATLISEGRKRYETRSWAPPAHLIGERIAIHAGAKRSKWQSEAAREFGLDDLPLGVIVCTARLVAAHYLGRRHSADLVEVLLPASMSIALDPDLQDLQDVGRFAIRTDEYGDYAMGRWAWRLVDVQLLDPPAPALGHQGLWWWGGL